MSETSSGQFKVACSCGKKLRLPVSAAGRRAKCPSCKTVFKVPSPPPARPAPAESVFTESDDDMSLLDELAADARSAEAIPKSPEASLGAPCAKCGADMAVGVVMCVSCGHNAQTGRTLKQASARRSDIGAIARWMAARGGTFAYGCFLSGLGALIGAVIWSVVAVVTNYEIGWIAWGLGVLAGYGMSVGYPTEKRRAGVTAACIAMFGIVGAKFMAFVYFNYDELSEATEYVTAEGDENADLRYEIAYDRAVQAAQRQGLSPTDSRREGIYEREEEGAFALTPEELQETYAELEAWQAGARWEDEQYVRNFLIYARTGDATEKLYPPENFVDDDEVPVPTPAEWKEMYGVAVAAVDAMTTEERAARAGEIIEEEERAAVVSRLAAHRAYLRRLRVGVSWMDPRAETFYDEETEPIEALSDEERASAIGELDAWEDGGKWQDQEYMRNRLIELHTAEGMADVWEKIERDSDDSQAQYETEWRKQYENAVALVDAIPADQHAENAREMEAQARRRTERMVDEYRDEYRTAQAKEAAGDVMGFFFENYFSAFDILFCVLAVGSAFKIATGGTED